VKSSGHSDLRAEGLLLLCVMIWGANYSVSKFGISRVDPLVYNALRYLIGAGCLQVILLRSPRRVPVAAGDRGPLIRAGLIANVFNQLAFILGLSLTSAGNAAIILATAPLLTVLLSARVSRSAVPAGVWAGSVLSLVGVAAIVAGSGRNVEVGSTALMGDLLCVLAAFLWAFNTNLQKPLVGKYSPVQVAAAMVGVGAVGLCVAALPVLPSVSWDRVDGGFIAAAVWSGVFSIAIGNVIWSTGIKRLGPDKTANFGNLIPVIGFLVSLSVLGELFDVVQAAGAALTVGGVWLARARSVPPRSIA
jgi:drug/metabolite transporter (DMT)-like permease